MPCSCSYGSWPSDVLLTRWGFVPDKLDSPHEATVIFFGLEELAAFHLALADELHGEGDSYLQQQQQQQQQGQQPEEAAVGALVAALEADLDSSRQDYYRLAVTADGFDARLLRAAEALLRAESMPPSMLTGLLALRLERLLEAFPTGLDEDLELLQQLECGSSACNGSSSSAVERLLAAVRCRTSKKRVLLSALQAMQP